MITSNDVSERTVCHSWENETRKRHSKSSRTMSKLILRSFLVISSTIISLGMVEHERVFCLGFLQKKRFRRNHSLLFEKHSCMGVLKENPIHQEMNEAMHLAGV